MAELDIWLGPLIMGIVVAVHAMFLLNSLLRRFVKCVRGKPSEGSPEEDVEEDVEEDPSRLTMRLGEIHVQSYLALLQVWSHISAIYAVFFTVRTILSLQTLADWVMCVIVAASYFVSLITRLWPHLVGSGSLWLLHSTLMSIIFGFGIYATITDLSVFAHYYTQMLLLRGVLAVGFPKFLVNLFWNSAWGILSIVGKLRFGGPRADTPITNIIGNEFLVVGFLSYVLWQFELLQVAHVRSEMQASGYLRAKKTMERMLEDMCDAVVHLDHNLCIQQACPKLASLLLRHTSAKSLKDEELASVVFSETDRERFSNFVAQRAVPVEHQEYLDNQQSSASMYLHLRDSNSTPVSVQVFHSCHRQPPDNVCHIIGVHEVIDDNAARAATDTFGDARGRQHPQARRREAPRGDASSVAVVIGRPDNSSSDADSVVSVASGRRSNSSTLSSLAPLIPDGVLPSSRGLIFDAANFQIIACTVQLFGVTGPLSFKSGLRGIIKNFGEFRYWVRREVRRCIAGADPTYLTSIITQPSGRRGNIEFEADCAILDARTHIRLADIVPGLAGDEGEKTYDLLAVLVFREPQPPQPRNPTEERVNEHEARAQLFEM